MSIVERKLRFNGKLKRNLVISIPPEIEVTFTSLIGYGEGYSWTGWQYTVANVFFDGKKNKENTQNTKTIS